jgi:hypothetical protein
MSTQLKEVVAQNPETARFSNDADMKLFTDSLLDVIKTDARQTDRTMIKTLFDGEDKNSGHPAVQQLCGAVSETLTLKGMPAADAQLLAGTTLPHLFNMYNTQIAEAKSKGLDIPQMMDDVLSGKFNFTDIGKLMSIANIFMKGKNSFSGKLF